MSDRDERPPPAETDGGLHVWADPDGGDRASGREIPQLSPWTRQPRYYLGTCRLAESEFALLPAD